MEVKPEAKAPSKGLIVLLPVLIILAAVSFVFAFNANAEAQKYKKMFEKEMAFRLDVEEKVNQLRSEKIELSSAADTKDLQIQEKDKKIAELTQSLSTKDTEITSLKSEIDKLNSLTNQAEAANQASAPVVPQQ